MTLDQFFERLDALGDSIPLLALKELLCELHLEFENIDNHIRFDDGKYQRNLLNRTPSYEALLLCFEPGQQTPIHDHAGSACGVKVIRGVATEVGYKPDSMGKLAEVGTRELPADGVVGSADMEAADVEVLGPTDHGIIKSIYLFDPNGHRLELTSVTASDEQLEKLNEVKWEILEEWTQTKGASKKADWLHAEEFSQGS